ncbi:hypothetical protein Z043_118343, partial [Scleropages formosus]
LWNSPPPSASLPSVQRVPRTGWVYRHVKNPESVSDHMYRMAVMALTLADESFDKSRCIKLALVHDMAECIVGDIAPADNVSKEEKHRREEDAMKHLTSLLKDSVRKEIYELWEVPSMTSHLFVQEYESQLSPEARLVKELDQLEMVLQAHEYEELEKNPGKMQEFFDTTQGTYFGFPSFSLNCVSSGIKVFCV